MRHRVDITCLVFRIKEIFLTFSFARTRYFCMFLQSEERVFGENFYFSNSEIKISCHRRAYLPIINSSLVLFARNIFLRSVKRKYNKALGRKYSIRIRKIRFTFWNKSSEISISFRILTRLFEHRLAWAKMGLFGRKTKGRIIRKIPVGGESWTGYFRRIINRISRPLNA